MKKIVFLAGALLALAGCDFSEKVNERKERRAQIDAEIEVNGFADMGVTPDGQRIYLMKLNRGYSKADDVYVIGNSATYSKTVGKNVHRTITSVGEPTK